MSKMVDYSSCDPPPYISVEHQGDEYSPGIADTLRSLSTQIKSYKENNDRLVEAHERLARAHEKQEEVNAMIIHNFLDFQI